MPVDLTPEEVEENTKDLVLSGVQFFNLAMSLRVRTTALVGEVMSAIEIANLSPNAERALKDTVKRAIWSSTREIIEDFGNLSEATDQEVEDAKYN